MQTELFPTKKPTVHINLNLALRDMSPKKRELFYKWHNKNPFVWKAIENIFLDKAKNGQKRIGLKEIFEELRQTIIKEKNDDEWKLNNNWTSAYARILAFKYPELSHFLEIRRALSDD
jgi:hypothetical protein